MNLSSLNFRLLTNSDFGVKEENVDRSRSHINVFCAILKATFIPIPWIGFFWVPLTPMEFKFRSHVIHNINWHCFLALETCYHQKFTVPSVRSTPVYEDFFGRHIPYEYELTMAISNLYSLEKERNQTWKSHRNIINSEQSIKWMQRFPVSSINWYKKPLNFFYLVIDERLYNSQ